MLKKIKIYSVMFLLFALFSCGILNATEYINLNTDSNQIYSTRGVFCETCGHQYPHYFYIVNKKTRGYICNKKAPDTMLSHKPHAKRYCSLYVTEEAPLVQLLKSFFDSSNWTTSEESNQTTIYTITPTSGKRLTITFVNSNHFTLSCGNFNESFSITKHDSETSASVIFKAFEFYCYAQGKRNYFNSDTRNISNCNPKKSTDLNSISLETSEKLNQSDTYSSDNFAIPSTPMKGKNFVAPLSTTSFVLERKDFATPLAPMKGKNFVATPPSTTSFGLERKDFATPSTPIKRRNFVAPLSTTSFVLERKDFATPLAPMKGKNSVATPSTTSFGLERKNFAMPLVPTSKRVKKDSRASLMYTPQKTPGKGLYTPTTYGHGKYYVTPEKKTKDTGKKYFTGGSCGIAGIVQNIKRHILDISNWKENVTSVRNLFDPIENVERGWYINLNDLLSGFPEFYNERIIQNINDLQSRNSPLSPPEQPFFLKRFGLTLYCFSQRRPDENLRNRAFNYLCKILKIDAPKFEIH